MKPTKKSNFRNKVTSDSEKQKKNSNSSSYLNLPKGIHTFTPEPGSRVKLDFIPYEVTDKKHPDRDSENDIAMPGTLWYKRPYKTHRSVGANNETIVCPTSIGMKCPICEYARKRADEGADKEETKELWAKPRNLYIVIPRDSDKHDEAPYIFDISWHLFQKLLNEELSENEDNSIFPDIEEGLTLKVRFETQTMTNKKKKTEWEEAKRIDFLERETQLDESILENVPNLDEILKILSYDEIHAKFFEMENETNGGKLEEVEEDDKPKKSVSQRDSTKLLRESHNKDKEENEDKKRHENHVGLRKKEKGINTEDLTWDDLIEFTESKLIDLIESSELNDIDPEDYEDDIKALREAIAKELDIKIPERKKFSQGSEEQKTQKSSIKQKCPSKYQFGVDTGKYEECDDCDLYDECMREKKRK